MQFLGFYAGTVLDTTAQLLEKPGARPVCSPQLFECASDTLGTLHGGLLSSLIIRLQDYHIHMGTVNSIILQNSSGTIPFQGAGLNVKQN